MLGGSGCSGESAWQCRLEKGRRRTRARRSGGMAGRDGIAVRETSTGG